MRRKLYLVTKEFPYGKTEDSFARLEYPYLCKEFDVTVITAELQKQLYDVPQDMNSKLISSKQSLLDKVHSFLVFITKKECYYELRDIIGIKNKRWARIYRMLMFGTAAETFYRRLKRTCPLNAHTDTIFYFYWYDYRCFALTMHKKEYPNIKVIARTHGCDLYDDRELYGKQFFQRQMDANVERLIFAADYAKEYYLRRYDIADSLKYPVHRLGVSNTNINIESRINGFNKEFLLLSCARCVELKRIDRIIDGLSTITQENVRWVHIGDGEALDHLTKYAKRKLGDKKNIEYQFLGNLSNKQVIEFYKDNYVSCFITTTESEGGAPVAVQEALSYGVPVIATCIGELNIMVKDNGILLDDVPDAKDIGEAIAQIYNKYGTDEYKKMCNNSLEIYNEMFNECKNYNKLLQELIML